MSANDKQVGGTHYQGHDVQHWEYAYARDFDCFQYIITKWIERWKKKGGLEDLLKAQHALDKYVELVTQEKQDCGLGRNYVDQ